MRGIFSAIWKSLLCCGILVLGTVPATAGTVSITSPSNNAEVNCTVLLTAVTVPTPTEGCMQVAITVRNASNVIVASGMMTRDPGTNDNWSLSWNTSGLGTATYTVTAAASFRDNVGMGGMTVISLPITLKTKHGFEVVADVAKTYAKVNSPANNSTITNSTGGMWTLNTDHQITFKKHDTCTTKIVQCRWIQTTTWNPTTTRREFTTPMITLSGVPGEQSVNLLGWAINYNKGLPIGDFTADAFSNYPVNNPVVHGANPYHVVM
jgi:hypothetical protein